MLNAIVSFSIRNKLVVGILTLALVVWGLVSFQKLSIDAVPDITNNQVQVVTTSQSLAPQEMEKFVTQPIELNLANLQGVTQIRSISRYGLSIVTVVFEENVPFLDARQLVLENLQKINENIPKDCDGPELMPITTGLGEIFQYTLDVDENSGVQYSNQELRTIQDWIVKRQLSGIPGVVEISSFGGNIKQYEVAVNPANLKSKNISITDVYDALTRNNANTGGSYIEKGDNAYYVRALGLIQNLDDIKNIVVKVENSVPLTIGQIAEINMGNTPRLGAMTKDGKGEAVGGIALMYKGANANVAIANIEERIEKIQKSLPKGISIVPYLERSHFVDRVMGTVAKNLIEGGLIVVFVLVLLLGNFRAGLLVASVIPLSLLFAFSMMHLFGVSANLMSLGAIDFGIVVDGAVIIVESVIHHLQLLNKNKEKSNISMDETVRVSASKIMSSSSFGVIIILIVYFPIMFLEGIEGKMFMPMAQTVSFAIIGAFLMSITYIPMMSAVLLSAKTVSKENFSDKLIQKFQNILLPVLEKAYRFKKTTVGISFGLLLTALLIFSNLGAVFIPTLEEGDLAMQMQITAGSSISQSISYATKAEKILLDNFPEVKAVVSKIGTAEVPTDPMAIEDADVMIILKDKSEWTSANNREELAEKMKEKLGVLVGAGFEFTQPIQLRFNELLTGVKADIAIKIYGEDLEELNTKALEIESLIKNIQGAADVKVDRTEGLPQLLINYDRQKLARYGISIDALNHAVKSGLAGESAGLVYEGEKRFDLVVRMPQELRNDFKVFDYLSVRAADGNLIPVSQLAEIKFENGPMMISRENTQRLINVGINVRDRDIKSIVNEMNTLIEKNVQLKPGYFIRFGGQYENLESATKRLYIAVPAALFLIFVLLFFAFHSLPQAFMIFTAIPLSAIGGIFALWLRSLPFSISAAVGFIALFGVAVLNGIVLIAQFNELKKEGVNDIFERIKLGTLSRLRPVLMTALVASLGFLPMALSSTAGAEVQKPLATVVIGGLISSTLLTLIVLPILYSLFELGFFSLKRFKKPIALLLLVGLSNSALQAQNSPTKELTLSEALQMAEQSNVNLKTAQMQIEAAKKFKKSAFDIGLTSFDWQRGQINSAKTDNFFTISQEIGTPFEKIAFAKQLAQEQALAEIGFEQQKVVIAAEINSLFYQWLNIIQKEKLIEKYNQNLANNVSKQAEIQNKLGEINSLSALNIQLFQENLKQMLLQLQTEKLVNQNALQILLNSSEKLSFTENFASNELLLKLEETDLNNSSFLKFQEKQYDLKKSMLTVEKSKFLPGFKAGYFIQELENVKGFTGFQLGISMPLFFAPNAAKVQKAKVEWKIAESYLEAERKRLQIKKVELNRRLENTLLKKQSFENFQLKIAEKLEKNAFLLYKTGEISYIEFFQNLENIIQIQANYLNIQLEENLLKTELYYLGK